jgi:predicted kinase
VKPEMLVIMAGLPGSGKSTIARQLARMLPALILDKDAVRAGLFPPQEIEYSTRQDDFVVGIMLQIVRFYFQKDAERTLILDGRPFIRRYQVEMVTGFADKYGQPVRLIACTCSEDVARQRLERAAASGSHVAANRDFSLYQHLKIVQEPYDYPHLRVDTGRDLNACVQECLRYILSEDPDDQNIGAVS